MAQIGEDFGTILQLRLGRRELAGRHGIGEALAGVGAVTERLVGRQTASAEGNHGTAGESEGGAGGVQDLEVAFDADGPVIED